MNKEKLFAIHPTIRYAEAIKEICKPLNDLDIYYFSHAHIDEQGRFSGIGLEPEFAKVYVEKNYYHFDIHMANLPMNINEQYILWDTIERKDESKELYDDFQSFQLGHTFTIVQKKGKSKDYYHFSSKLGTLNTNEKYLRNLDLLKKFILYFKDKLASHKELKAALDIKLKIPDQNSGFLVTDHICQNIFEFNNQTDFDKFYIEESYLTQRELDCLKWLAAGKTLDEIALILGIKTITVNIHVKKIKEKFGCHNLFQLGVLYNKIPASIITSY